MNKTVLQDKLENIKEKRYNAFINHNTIEYNKYKIEEAVLIKLLNTTNKENKK